MSHYDGASPDLSGRGEHEFKVPDGLPGKSVVMEAWAGMLSRGFRVHGVRGTDQKVWDEFLGDSGLGRGRSHILLPVGVYSLLRVRGGVRKPGRWHIRWLPTQSLSELAAENTGDASHIFSLDTPGIRVAVEFGDAGGCLALYDRDGKQRRVVTQHTDKFRDVVTIPDAGLVAVQGSSLKWGPMNPWSLRVLKGA